MASASSRLSPTGPWLAETHGILLWIQFDGAEFAGFQRQADGIRSVGGELEAAWLRRFDEEVAMRASSRTDAGVHARRMPVLVRTARPLPPKAAMFGLNACLPDDVKVTAAGAVPDDFDVRADAVGKRYLYRVCAGPARLPLWRRSAWLIKGRLDVAAMREAASHLVGIHDFRAFRSAQCGAQSTVRHLHQVAVHDSGEVATIEVDGNAFLHNMVRIIAGTLVGVGRHRFAPADVALMIDRGDRGQAGQTAPAHGLCLDDVFYGPYGARQGTDYKALLDHMERARAAAG